MSTADDALRAAAQQIGTLEQPAGSNCNPYSKALGRPCEAWCADFLVWIMRQVHVPIPSESAYTPAMANAFRATGRWSTAPKRGAFVFYDFPDRTTGIEHVGLLESWTDTTVTSVDGNTSMTGSQDNGGAVCRRTRDRHYVVGYGYPDYTTGVAPRMNVIIDNPIVDAQPCPSGGEWLLSHSGAIYAFNCAYHGAPNGQSYWGTRQAAQLNVHPDGQGYTVVSTSGESYSYP